MLLLVVVMIVVTGLTGKVWPLRVFEDVTVFFFKIVVWVVGNSIVYNSFIISFESVSED